MKLVWVPLDSCDEDNSALKKLWTNLNWTKRFLLKVIAFDKGHETGHELSNNAGCLGQNPSKLPCTCIKFDFSKNGCI